MYKYFDVNFKNSKNTYFGYLEKGDNILFIFLQKEGDLETNTNEILVNFIVNEFLENSEFSSRFLKKLIIRTNDLFNEKKTCELGLKFLSSSILLILTNKSKYLIASSGNILASIYDKEENLKLSTRLDNIAYELYENSEITYDMIAQSKYRREVTNCLGGLKQLAINMTGELELELMDTILIEGINSWDSTNKDEDFARIKIKKIEKKEKGKKNSFLIVSLIIVFIIFILFILNKKRIFIYENKINEIKNNIKIYEKNKIYKNILVEVLKLEKIYENLYKEKLIYIPRKMEINYIKDTEYLKKLKKEIKEYEEIEQIIHLSELDIDNRNYISAKNKLEKLKNNYLKYKLDKINILLVKSIELNKAYENIENANKLLLNKEYLDIRELLDKSKEIYIKYKNKDLIELKIDPLLKKLDNEILNIKNIIEKNIKDSISLENKNLALVKLNDALNLATRVGDKELLNEINKEINLLEKEIEKLKLDAKTLKDEALIYLKEKKYRSSLEAFLESNIRFRKLGLVKEIDENSKTIRNIKEIINNDKKSTSVKNKKSDLEGEIIKSIYLSIEKGDEYISSNDFENALLEYERALNLSNKVKIPNLTIKKLKDKVIYAKEKINSAWW